MNEFRNIEKLIIAQGSKKKAIAFSFYCLILLFGYVMMPLKLILWVHAISTIILLFLFLFISISVERKVNLLRFTALNYLFDKLVEAETEIDEAQEDEDEIDEDFLSEEGHHSKDF